MTAASPATRSAAAEGAEERFEAMVEIALALGGSPDLATLSRVTRCVATLVRAERSSLFLVDPQTGELLRLLAQGDVVRLPRASGIAGHVAETGAVVNVADAPVDPRFDPEVDRLGGCETTSLLAVPLRGGDGAVVGVAQALNPRDGGAFGAGDERALAAMGSVVGLALERARLVASSRAKTAELEGVATPVEAERAGRLAALGLALSGVVHDLRSPVTVISGYTELLASETDAGERERFANLVLSQVDQVSAMIREVLAFVRGERRLLRRRVQLGHFFHALEEQLGRELDPRRCALRVTLEYDGAAWLDEGWIRRLVTNLARNAAQAMPEGGTFAIRCLAEGDALVLELEDDGPGLPPEMLARHFPALATHGREGGTGLGLALAKEAAARHGGSIDCRTAPGAGTTFTVRLPGAVAR